MVASTSSGRGTPSTPRSARSTSTNARLSTASAASSSIVAPSTPGTAASRLTAPTRASAARMAATNRNAARPQATKAKTNVKASSSSLLSSASASGSTPPTSAIQAYLRIRPCPTSNPNLTSSDDAALPTPYISVTSPNTVLMTPPENPTSLRSLRPPSPATSYTFARVFGPHDAASNSQRAFFRETTLPMVTELLGGESGLIFTYGVTNSGKSYTVQGGEGVGEAGLLPRALDVVFNSIEGLESRSNIAPLGLYGVERVESNTPTTAAAAAGGSTPPLDPWTMPSLKGKLAEASRRHVTPTHYQREEEKVRVDRNYRYSVWASYVEVYNEKLYDLLDVSSSSSSSASGMTRSDSVRGSNWSIANLASSNDLAGTASLTLNRRPLHLKTDPDGCGKYVSGLREIRLSTPSEARDLLRRGQENRIVFSTMANRSSSRSHGVFTIKVVREHAGAGGGPDDSLACTVSRLSIVDLAGSERISATMASGVRQREAGSINKSLMCLGQCLETLRKNQARAASMIPTLNPVSSLNSNGDSTPRAPPPSGKRRPSVVPFRHSKLTELFQPFFTGEGRTVMIVNANPYDTGFDENSHVMRFSAVAREVQTTRGSNEARAVPRAMRPQMVAWPCEDSTRGAGGADVTIIEDSPSDEDEDDNNGNESESDSEDSASTAFVDALLTRHEELRLRLHAAEERAATLEQEVREEMAAEFAQRLAEMEQRYTARMLSEVETGEEMLNRKIDLLVNATRGRGEADDRGRKAATAVQEESIDEEEGGESLVTANESNTTDNSVELQAGPFEEVVGQGSGDDEEESEEEEESEDDSSEEEASASDADSSYQVDSSMDASPPPPPPRARTTRRSTLTSSAAGRKSQPLAPRSSASINVSLATPKPKQRAASNLRPKATEDDNDGSSDDDDDDDMLIPSPSKLNAAAAAAATPRASNASRTSSTSPRKRRTLRSARAVDEEEIEKRVAGI